jgi:hypothetical protein
VSRPPFGGLLRTGTLKGCDAQSHRADDLT